MRTYYVIRIIVSLGVISVRSHKQTKISNIEISVLCVRTTDQNINSWNLKYI